MTPLWYDNLRTNWLFFNLRQSINCLPLEELAGKVFVVVGAGPSLRGAGVVEDLQAAKSAGCQIIATDAALRFLVQAGVWPDFTITGEEQTISAALFKDLPLEDSWPLVASCTANPLALYLWRGPIFFYSNAAPLLAPRFAGQPRLSHWPTIPGLAPLCGQVTFHGVALADFMCARVVALVGVDMEVLPSSSTHAATLPGHNIDREAMKLNFENAADDLRTNYYGKPAIVNSTRGGRLETFKRAPLKTVIDQCH